MLSLSRLIGLSCSPVRVVGERGAEDKARIVAEIVASGESVSAAADGTDFRRSSYLAGAGIASVPDFAFGC
jgi:hypothetical protein